MTTSTVSSLTQPTSCRENVAEDQDRLQWSGTEYNGVQKKRFVRGWISTESWRKIEERRTLKKTIDGARSERLKNKARKEYREKGKEVKRSLRKVKRDWMNSVAHEAEDAGQQGQMKGVYEADSRL